MPQFRSAITRIDIQRLFSVGRLSGFAAECPNDSRIGEMIIVYPHIVPLWNQSPAKSDMSSMRQPTAGLRINATPYNGIQIIWGDPSEHFHIYGCGLTRREKYHRLFHWVVGNSRVESASYL